MLPRDAAEPTDTHVLSIDTGVHVVLVGLGPVYAHGLRTGLSATGLRCTTVGTTADLPPLLMTPGSVVAVLPQHDGPTLATGQDHVADLHVVHLLPAASTEAYSDALRAGATGAFERDAELAHIVRTVQCAALGLALLPVDVARALNRGSVGPRPDLSERDLDYLRMLAHGATVAGLARRHGYSEREMYRLLSSVYRRLGAHNRTEALLLAQRYDLLGEQT